jgi:hypothetical protein
MNKDITKVHLGAVMLFSRIHRKDILLFLKCLEAGFSGFIVSVAHCDYYSLQHCL